MSEKKLDQIAKAQQAQADLVYPHDRFDSIETLLAAAVHHENDTIRSGGVLYELQGHLVKGSWISGKEECKIPYIPTYLALRNKKSLINVINHFWGK